MYFSFWKTFPRFWTEFPLEVKMSVFFLILKALIMWCRPSFAISHHFPPDTPLNSLSKNVALGLTYSHLFLFPTPKVHVWDSLLIVSAWLRLHQLTDVLVCKIIHQFLSKNIIFLLGSTVRVLKHMVFSLLYCYYYNILHKYLFTSFPGTDI